MRGSVVSEGGARAVRIRRRRLAIASAATVAVVAVFAVVVFAVRDQPTAAPVAAEGAVFPDFRLSGVDGAPIDRSTLAGKKALIWFTDSTCPDPDGLTRTAGLDDELGGQAFTVLAVLVDHRTPGPAQGEWRAAFGRADWLVGADERGELSARVGVRAVETKFLLDEQGIVLDVTTGLATEDYVTALRERVRS